MPNHGAEQNGFLFKGLSRLQSLAATLTGRVDGQVRIRGEFFASF